MTSERETLRLSTELELVAEFDLLPLLNHFGSRVEVMRNSSEGVTRTAWLDLCLDNENLDQAVAHYVTMIEEMPEPLRALWNACTDRCLNTGIQSGRQPHATKLELLQATVSGAARIGVRLVFTVYALD